MSAVDAPETTDETSTTEKPAEQKPTDLQDHPTGAEWRRAFGGRVKDQLGLRGVISEYLVPVETKGRYTMYVRC